MEISDAVGIRIREDNKGNNKEDMDSKNLFFLKFMLRFTHRRYIMIASHKLKRYQGKGIKIPLRTAAASFYQSVICFATILIVNAIVKHVEEDLALF